MLEEFIGSEERMESTNAEQVARSLLAAWNDRDLDKFLALLTDDVYWTDPAMLGSPASGKAAVRRFAESVITAFPDFTYAIRGSMCVSADGQRCIIPWRITGTHLARLEPAGFMPTNRRADFEGVDLLDFRDGLVCRVETYFDPVVPGGQLMALNLLPPPGSFRERILVTIQSAIAWWLRNVRKSIPVK